MVLVNVRVILKKSILIVLSVIILVFHTQDNYTKEDLEAYGRVEYARAVDDAIELIAFHGETAQLEAYIRQLKEY